MKRNTKYSLIIASVFLISVLLICSSINMVSAAAISNDDFYLEDYNNLANSSGYVNVTTDDGKLILEKTATQQIISLPNLTINDSWTEEPQWFGGPNGTWSMLGVAGGVLALNGTNVFYGVRSIHGIAIVDDPIPGFFFSFVPANPINASGFDRIEFAIETSALPFIVTGIEQFLFAGFVVTDSNGFTATNMQFGPPPLGIGTAILGGMWPIFTYGLNSLWLSNPSFDWGSIMKMDFHFDWLSQNPAAYGALGPIGVWLDFLHFEKDVTVETYDQQGKFYSDWISVPSNSYVNSLVYDGTDLNDVSISISDDNSTWTTISGNAKYLNVTSQNWTSQVIFKIEMNRTVMSSTPTVDFVATTFRPFNVPPNDHPPVILSFYGDTPVIAPNFTDLTIRCTAGDNNVSKVIMHDPILGNNVTLATPNNKTTLTLNYTQNYGIAGSHTFTLYVIDSFNHTATATVTIVWQTPPSPPSPPTPTGVDSNVFIATVVGMGVAIAAEGVIIAYLLTRQRMLIKI